MYSFNPHKETFSKINDFGLDDKFTVHAFWRRIQQWLYQFFHNFAAVPLVFHVVFARTEAFVISYNQLFCSLLILTIVSQFFRRRAQI